MVFWAILSSSCSFVRFDYQERIITHIGIRTPFFILFVAIIETLIYCNLIICVLNKITRHKNIILLVSCILFGLSHYDKNLGVSGIPLVLVTSFAGIIFVLYFYMYISNWMKATVYTIILHFCVDCTIIFLDYLMLIYR